MEVKDLEFASGNGISNVTFSFFNAERVRKTSVKQITRSATFDRLGRPQRDGLYDAALGPVDPLERCATCAQSYPRTSREDTDAPLRRSSSAHGSEPRTHAQCSAV